MRPVAGEIFSQYLRGRPRTEFSRPSETVWVKLDKETGERLPDDATGPNVVSELFRRGEEPSLHQTVRVLGAADDSFSFGTDLPFSLEGEPVPEYVTRPDGTLQPVTPPPPGAQLDLGSGGLY
ncbi:MAG: hypothetical protein KatS3mg118_2922 [Paracoccaceae bacterium]|nr:MAG: hypothetical protein KatS3mg118_2922 [Paracoccaceae bacterium]